MSIRRDQGIRPEVFLDVIVSERARVAGDVIEVGPHTWAIHGTIAASPVSNAILSQPRMSPPWPYHCGITCAD